MRARKKKWTGRELETNGRIITDPAEHMGRWGGFFTGGGPIHAELGCGKGRFITETALANPGVNYIAMEREPHVIVSGARAARERGIDNVVFVLADVTDILAIFQPGEVSRLYINFCDPWPNKKKWAKRRLTHARFLDMYARLMGGPGEVFFKTDSRQLFEFSLNQFCEQGWRMRNITLDLHKSDFQGNVMTEYEERFSLLGMPIYRLEAYNGTTITKWDDNYGED